MNSRPLIAAEVLLAGALAACGPEAANTPLEDTTHTTRIAFPGATDLVAHTVNEEVVHTIVGDPRPSGEEPVPVGREPLPEVEGGPQIPGYQRPSEFPDSQDIYFFPKDGHLSGEVNIGQISRLRPVEFGEYYAEAPTQDIGMRAQWEMALNGEHRHLGLPQLTREAVESTRFRVVVNMSEAFECDVATGSNNPEEATIDCGDIPLPQTESGQAHTITLFGEFPEVQEDGVRHFNLGGYRVEISPSLEFTTVEGDSVEGVSYTNVHEGMLAAGRVTFYADPDIDISMISQYPTFRPGHDPLINTRTHWGVVEGDPIYVTGSESTVTMGQRVLGLDSEPVGEIEWATEETRQALEWYKLLFGTENKIRGSGELIPGERRTTGHRAILRSEECIIEGVCSTPPIYDFAVASELGGDGCEFPAEVCAVAPSAYIAGISVSTLFDFSFEGFMDPEDPRFERSFSRTALHSITSNAERMTFVEPDGTISEAPAIMLEDGQKRFYPELAPVVADLDIGFGTCFSGEVDTRTGEITATVCSCEHVELNPSGLFVCPEPEEQD